MASTIPDSWITPMNIRNTFCVCVCVCEGWREHILKSNRYVSDEVGYSVLGDSMQRETTERRRGKAAFNRYFFLAKIPMRIPNDSPTHQQMKSGSPLCVGGWHERYI